MQVQTGQPRPSSAPQPQPTEVQPPTAARRSTLQARRPSARRSTGAAPPHAQPVTSVCTGAFPQCAGNGALQVSACCEHATRMRTHPHPPPPVRGSLRRVARATGPTDGATADWGGFAAAVGEEGAAQLEGRGSSWGATGPV